MKYEIKTKIIENLLPCTDGVTGTPPGPDATGTTPLDISLGIGTPPMSDSTQLKIYTSGFRVFALWF